MLKHTSMKLDDSFDEFRTDPEHYAGKTSAGIDYQDVSNQIVRVASVQLTGFHRIETVFCAQNSQDATTSAIDRNCNFKIRRMALSS